MGERRRKEGVEARVRKKMQRKKRWGRNKRRESGEGVLPNGDLAAGETVSLCLFFCRLFVNLVICLHIFLYSEGQIK